MHNKTAKQIQILMHDYTTKGKKSAYKKKQMKRLFQIIDDIFQHSQITNVERISKKHIIAYYQRIEHETEKTRNEKYQIMKRFFNVLNPALKVPMPRAMKTTKIKW